MRRSLLSLALAAACAAPAFTAAQNAGSEPAVQDRKAITSPAQLPRRQYAITMLPSEMVTAPRAQVQPVLDALDKDLAADLADFDIQDRATRNGVMGVRAQVAAHRGDAAGALALIRQIRAQQDKPADRLTNGVVLEQILLARQAGGSLDEQRARFRQALAEKYGAMPWALVGDNVTDSLTSYGHMAREVMLGAVKSRMDPQANKADLVVPAGLLAGIVAVRNTFELVLPFREDILAVLQALVDRNRTATASQGAT